MTNKKHLILLTMTAVALSLFLATAAPSFAASKEKVLHSFNPQSQDGFDPSSELVFDAAGNLYGTTFYGGLNNCSGKTCGTVFELSPSANGGWTEKVLHRFTGKGGSNPVGRLTFGADGSLYGATLYGGNPSSISCQFIYGCGTVFQLTRDAHGKWSETVLHNFCSDGPNCNDGSFPVGALVSDAAGNLYGATNGGGAYNLGAVFRLTPGADGKWTETLLHSFGSGADGSYPFGGVIFDAAGNLYGTTGYGGDHRFGTVFELSPGANRHWSENVLYSFSDGSDGYTPNAGLIHDKAGNLYGTGVGGGAGADGVVFQLMSNGHGKWTENVLHSFSGADGDLPLAGLIFDGAGKLYGTTAEGGGSGCQGVGCGVVFQLAPEGKGKWTETILYSFTGGSDGNEPARGLVLTKAGNLYGTTAAGGAYSGGVVFELEP